MSRYIDADKLKNHALTYVHTSPHFHYGDWDNMSISGKEIDEIIDTCPTTDLDEVRHGEWNDIGEAFCECSVCETMFEALPTKFGFKVNNKFCRYCGAKMDGERRENDET